MTLCQVVALVLLANFGIVSHVALTQRLVSPLPRKHLESVGIPHGHACLPPHDGYAFCNTALPLQERVADLVSRLTLTEKIAALDDWQANVSRLGLPDLNFENEGLHGLGGLCFNVSNVSGTRCPSVFPIPPALGASWNVSLLRAIGTAIGREQRAFNNWGGQRADGPRPVDLGIWLLVVDLARDPRVSLTVGAES